MLAEPGLASKAGDVAEGDHEVVIRELELARAHPRGEGDALALQIDLFDGPRVEIGARAETSDGRDGVEDADAPRHHLGQRGLEGEVVVAAHQRDLDLAAPELALEDLLQRERGVYAPEAAAENENAGGWDRVHVMSSPSRSASASVMEVRWMRTRRGAPVPSARTILP